MRACVCVCVCVGCACLRALDGMYVCVCVCVCLSVCVYVFAVSSAEVRSSSGRLHEREGKGEHSVSMLSSCFLDSMLYIQRPIMKYKDSKIPAMPERETCTLPSMVAMRALTQGLLCWPIATACRVLCVCCMQGIRYSPTFHLYRGGKVVDQVLGKDPQRLEDHLWLHCDAE